MSQRLDALLARSLGWSRKQAAQAIRAGRIEVDGARARSGSRRVDDQNAIRCDGEAVVAVPDPLHLLLHKPVGVACSRDPREAPLVHEVLPAIWAALIEPVGRLDRATSGLLLLTSDGKLNHRLTSPKHHVAKRYRLRYRGTLVADAVTRCAAGLALPDDDRALRPAELDLEGDDRASLVIREGRFHQVRRMIAALGGEVTELHRDRIGALDLPTDLAPGAWRRATDAEIAALSAEQP